VSNRSRVILIGSLVGAAIGAAVGFIYSELSAEEERAIMTPRSGLRFRGDPGDLVKLGFAVIPLVKLITNMFVPAEEE
jgi:gas vesicle protein